MNGTVNILLADDHQILLESLAESINFSARLQVVGTAIDGREVLQKLEIYEVDVLVCDMQMPVLDGISTVLKVRVQFPGVKILMLSMQEEVSQIERAIHAGAHGYILKKAKKAELETAILTIMEGKRYFPPDILQLLELEKPVSENLPSVLSLREIEILKLIAQENTSQQIAAILKISLNTVESHRKNIYRKLGIQNLAGAIRFALDCKLLD